MGLLDAHAVVEFDQYPGEWTRVRLSGFSMRVYEAIYEAANATAARMSPENLRNLREALAPVLDTWSYLEPCDVDGLAERDPNWLLALAREWVMGVRDVPLPLPRKSSDGEASEDQGPESPLS